MGQDDLEEAATALEPGTVAGVTDEEFAVQKARLLNA